MNVLSVILIFILLVVVFILGEFSFLEAIRRKFPATFMILQEEIKMKKKIMEEQDHANA